MKSGVDAIRLALEAAPVPLSVAYLNDAVAPKVAAVTRSGDLHDTLADQLDALSSEVAYLPGEEVGHPNGLWIGRAGRIGFGLCPRVSNALEGRACHWVLGVIAGSIRARVFRHPGEMNPEILDRRCVLEDCGEKVLAPGETLVAEAGRDVIQLSGEGLFIEVETAPVFSARLAYDRETLGATAVIAGNLQVSQMDAALEMLSYVGTRSHAAVCVALAKHPAHFIRWSAIQAASALDPNLARDLLRDATRDPHPHVSSAAEQSLAMLGHGETLA